MGETLITPVTVALEDRLRLEKDKRAPKRTAERILEFAARFSAGIEPGAASIHHAVFLYDEHGLPN